MKHKKAIFALIVAVVIIAAIGSITNHYLQRNVFYPLDHYDNVVRNVDKYNIDPLLIMAIIKAESNFNEKVVSHKGAVGLMQITPRTGEWIAEQMGMTHYNINMLKSPYRSIDMGVWYIDYLIDYYDGNRNLALAAYNAGTGNIDKWLENGKIKETGDIITLPYKETSDYIVRINTYYRRYHQLYAKELQR